jgi:hypothetical protein
MNLILIRPRRSFTSYNFERSTIRKEFAVALAVAGHGPSQSISPYPILSGNAQFPKGTPGGEFCKLTKSTKSLIRKKSPHYGPRIGPGQKISNVANLGNLRLVRIQNIFARDRFRRLVILSIRRV